MIRYSFVVPHFGTVHDKHIPMFKANYKAFCAAKDTELIIAHGVCGKSECKSPKICYDAEWGGGLVEVWCLIDPNLPFQKSVVLNHGALAARGKFMLFHDADVTFDSDRMDIIRKNSETNNAFLNWSECRRIHKNDSLKILEDPIRTRFAFGL